MKKFKNGTGAAETVQPNGVLQLDRRAERAYMFDRICRQERERFYEESMHGVDWEAMCATTNASCRISATTTISPR